MNSIDDYEKVIDHIYGVYLHSSSGLVQLLKNFTLVQKNMIKSLKRTNPKLANLKYLDSKTITYGKGNPDDPNSVKLHRCTQGEYKERNSKTGINQKFLANMALVSLFQYWEDFHRENIASDLGMDKNDLKSPIMGDIRLIRISIIHHAGIALKRMEKCEILKWFKEGDDIFINEEMFQDIIKELKNFLNELRK